MSAEVLVSSVVISGLTYAENHFQVTIYKLYLYMEMMLSGSYYTCGKLLYTPGGNTRVLIGDVSKAVVNSA